MKKLATCLLVAAGLLVATSMSAQNKIGYIDVSALVTAMPEFTEFDKHMSEYQKALNEQYADLVGEYNRKDSILNKDSLKMTPSQREVYRKNLENLLYRIQGWQRQAEQLYSSKQQELLTPVQAKAMKAVSDVAKENGYGFVFSRQALVIEPPAADDLLPLAKKKLGLK